VVDPSCTERRGEDDELALEGVWRGVRRAAGRAKVEFERAVEEGLANEDRGRSGRHDLARFLEALVVLRAKAGVRWAQERGGETQRAAS